MHLSFQLKACSFLLPNTYMPNITITRHAPSCNNITSNPFAKVAEPAIIDKGIKDAILIGKSLPWLNPEGARKIALAVESLDTEKPPLPSFPLEGADAVVFVSPLLRTWMTATCIMSRSTSLTLKVSRYLKEYDLGISIDSGNLPATFDKQVTKFLDFLNYLQRDNFNLDSIIVQLDDPSVTGNLVEFYKTNVVEWRVKEVNKDFDYTDEYKKYYPEGIQTFIKSKLSSATDIHAVAHNELMEHCLTNLGRPTPPQKENLWSIVVSASDEDESTWKVWRISGIALEFIATDYNVLCRSSSGGKRSLKKRGSRVSKHRKSKPKFSRRRR